MNFLIIISILIFAIFLFLLWTRRHFYVISCKIPGLWGFPIIGNLLELHSKDIDERIWFLLDKMVEYKTICKIWFGPFLVIGMCKPEYVQVIINKRVKKGIFYYGMKPYITDSILIAPASMWKQNRKALNPTFHQEILKTFVKRFEKTFHDFSCKLKEQNHKETFYIYPNLHEFVLKSAFSTMFNIKNHNGVNFNLIHQSIKDLLNITWHRILNMFMIIEPLWYLNPSSRKAKKIHQKLMSHLNKIISERRKYLQNNPNPELNGKRKAFLDYLIEDDRFSDSQKGYEFLLMIIASTDTVSNTIGFGLLLLGMNPEIQNKLYEEIIEIVGPVEAIQNEHFAQMDYLDRVIKETTRLFPAIPILNRYIDEDVDIGPYTIPKGTEICIPTFVLHRDPDLWSNPLKFDPDRFLPEEVAKRHPYSFIPFSGGTRNCIGYQYGLKIMKYFFVSFVREYKVSTSLKSVDEIPVRIEIDLKSLRGYPVQLEPRQ